jgi:hypothetical protein
MVERSGEEGGWEEAEVRLEERDLWLRFQALTNEMIVTKLGRSETHDY